ncbi:putative dual specificity phosphatase [Elaphomyces granulatus]
MSMEVSLGSPTSIGNEHFEGGEQKDKNEPEEGNQEWKITFTKETSNVEAAAWMREIVPGLFLGNMEASYNRDMLLENCINAIVSLTRWALWPLWTSRTRQSGVPEHRHKWVGCVDSTTQDLLVHMSDICDFIDQMASPALQSSSTLPVKHEHGFSDNPCGARSEAILIHCSMGRSRSPTIIIAYLMRKYGAKREDVLAFVQSKQNVKPRSNFTRQLEVWEEVGYQVWQNEERTIPKAPYRAFLDDRAALLKEKGLTGNEPL